MAVASRPIVRRRVLVTGGGRGLGRAMALALVGAGHQVIMVDRLSAEVDDACAMANRLGAGEAFGVSIDLTEHDAAGRIMGLMDSRFGGIDVLINNAGLGPSLVAKDYFQNPPNFDDLSDEMVRLFFEVNGIAPFLLCVHAARRMRRQSWGRIVNVTTSHDSMMRRGFAPYGGTKASLESHSAIMARDLDGSGVTVNVLIPGGAADTEMIPQEAGFDRSQLISPQIMIAPLLWVIQELDNPPHGKRIVAAKWSSDVVDQAAMSAIGWPLAGGGAIIPEVRKS